MKRERIWISPPGCCAGPLRSSSRSEASAGPESRPSREPFPPFVGSPRARILHTDALRKRLFGVEPAQRLDVRAYTMEVNLSVYRRQREAAAQALRGGYSVIA